MDIGAYGEMEFAAKLEKLIGLSGKSQSAIARETGLNQSAISAMTRGDRRPYMDQALLLARAINVPLDYLADPAQDEPPVGEQLPEDEAAVLRYYRSKKVKGELDEGDAITGMASMVRLKVGQAGSPPPIVTLTGQEALDAIAESLPAPEKLEPVDPPKPRSGSTRKKA